jgi:hypothetical protein
MDDNGRLRLFFNGASLCFCPTETLLYEAKHPVGLCKTLKTNRYEDDKKSK